jgi:hypothetical protein
MGGLISTTIPSLINGVSQQPATLRLRSQGESQVNYFDSVVEGKKKRPATHHMAKLYTGNIGNAFCHLQNRDVNERYITIITDSDLKVYDLDTGQQKTVNFPDGKSYLNSSNPKQDFAVCSVADWTFIVNKSTSVAKTSSLSPSRGVEAIVFVKQANYETDYKIFINGAEKATFTTGDSGSLKTTNIVTDLVSDLTTNLGTGWTIDDSQSTIHIAKDDGSDFEIKVEDSKGNTQMKLAKGQIQRFSDLPTIAPTGFVVKVVGDRTSNFDDYYVKFKPNNNSADFDEGVWVETVKPGIPWEIDGATMPHALIREADGTFSFEELSWGKRECGDEDSAPDPTFVGTTINDVFFFDNRLGILADENVIFSQSAEFFDFYPSTVTTLVDSDRIDAAASDTKVSILQHAIPWDERVLFFSDQTQFILKKDEDLTPNTGRPKVLTRFQSSTACKPTATGNNVFFAINRGEFSGIQEYYVAPETEVQDAADITSHVPKYIPKNVHKMACTSNENMLVVLSSDDPATIYVYKFFWSGEEKLQSSWSKWTFNHGEILDVNFIESTMYLVIQYEDGVYLERMYLAPDHVDPDEPIEYLLDRKVTDEKCAISYDSPTDTTTWTLPYSVPTSLSNQLVLVIRGVNGGRLIQGVSVSDGIVTAPGDVSNESLFIGLNYEARYRFSNQHLMEKSDSGGRTAVAQGRLQLRTISIVYSDTGYFKLEITPRHRTTTSYTHTGMSLGTGEAVLNEIIISSGHKAFPVMSKSDQVIIELVNDSYLPLRMTAAGFEGFYHLRSSRV